MHGSAAELPYLRAGIWRRRVTQNPHTENLKKIEAAMEKAMSLDQLKRIAADWKGITSRMSSPDRDTANIAYNKHKKRIVGK